MRLTPQGVLQAYEQRINQHDFALLVDLIAPDAVFWFSDGSHRGVEAIRVAFEKTWAALANETYWLDQCEWIAQDEEACACIYRFNWRSAQNGRPISGTGRGTTVLRLAAHDWQIVHEHLSPARD